MRAKASVLIPLAGVVTLAACINIYVYFPEKELRKAAEKIVDEVRPELADDAEPSDGDAEGNEPDLPAGEPTGAAFPSLGLPLAMLYLPPTLGQLQSGTGKIKIDLSSPKIKAVKQTLKKRFPKLLPFFDSGVVGEDNKGLLATRDLTGLNLKQKRDLRLLVEAENKDRLELYTEIAVQNSIEKSEIPNIGKLFSEQWQKKCKTGWWIQDKKGKWIKKKPPKPKEK